MDVSDEVRIIIVDDHLALAQAVGAVIGLEDGLKLVAVAPDVESAQEYLMRDPSIDTALVDVNMPGMDGIDGIAVLRQVNPTLRVVIFTGDPSARVLQRAVAAGATGYVSKESSLHEVIESLRRPVNSGMFISSRAVAKLAATATQVPPAQKDSLGLTPREMEVVRQLADGKAIAAIAREQYLSVHTLRDHLKSVYRKLGVHSQLEAVAMARRHGLIDDDS